MTKKSYNKFVATAATATLVASAIAPVAASADSKQFTDVNERYAPAVDYVVSKGVQGKTSTQFGVQDSIKRVDAAVFIANALDLNKPGSPDAGFSDVPARAKDAVNALKEKGIINGKTDTRYGANDVLTRGEVALILASAYNLKGDADSLKFTDVNKNRYGSAVAGLVEQGVTNGISATKFGTENPVKRGDLAKFLYGLSGETPEVPSTDGITSVKAINDTKFEVQFGKAIDKDIAREIEADAKRFIIFDGGQTANSDGVIQSDFISFSDDYKTATFTIEQSDTELIKTDIKYTVALMDSNKNEVASVIADKSGVVLKEGASQPNIIVNAGQDQLVIDFKVKMDEEALTLSNYTLYDENDKEMGTLEKYSDMDPATKGKWVDGTEKKAVKFDLKTTADQPVKKLQAGKSYKVVVDNNVVTDKGDKLSTKQKTITVKTPSVSEAQPVAKIARIAPDKSSVIVTFDKDIDVDNLNFNDSLVEITTASGKTLELGSTVVEKGDTDKEIKINVATDEIKSNQSYKVNLPANGVANAYFSNATNKEVKGLKADLQEDIAIKSLKASLLVDTDAEEADLLLEFDRRVDVAAFVALTNEQLKEIKIEKSGKTYTLQNTDTVELYTEDTSGKTLRIKDIEEVFAASGDDKLELDNKKDYQVSLGIGTVKVAAGENARTNTSKLTSTIQGVAVKAPKIDSVTFESAEKLVVAFDQDIVSGTVKASDIKVAGFEISGSGKIVEQQLSGEKHIKVSTSGSTLTITPANSNVKLATGVEDEEALNNLITIKGDAVKGTNGIVATNPLNATAIDFVKDVKDNAAPVIVSVKVESADTAVITYSEAVDFKTSGANNARQFDVKNVERNAYGTTVSGEGTASLTVTFNETGKTFKADVDYTNAELIYSPLKDLELQDAKQNDVKKQTFKGFYNAFSE